MKEMVKVTLEVPRGIVDFVTDLLKFSAGEKPVEQFLAEELTASVKSILQDLPAGWFDEKKILKKYGLAET